MRERSLEMDEAEAEAEHIRFNSSITSEITLITSKLDQKNGWCEESTQNVRHEDLTPLNCFHFKLEQDTFKTSYIHVCAIFGLIFFYWYCGNIEAFW